MAQFEDAPDVPTGDVASLSLTAPAQPPLPNRASGAYIDTASAPEPELVPEEEDEEDDYYDEEDEWERELQGGLNEVMDQDWDVVSGDFTKRYNRMKQHVVASHAASQPSPLSANSTASTSSAPSQFKQGSLLPATNRPKTVAPPTPTGATRMTKVSDQLAMYSHYSSRLSVEPLHPTNAAVARKGGAQANFTKDKAERATVEQVLDPRTRLILFKMLNRGLIARVDGCISTGKEANVYHAVSPDMPDDPAIGPSRRLALKIYKTSILVFKDRDRYVSGEFRFKNGYARSNPRKMVRLWAEKELRNLKRMKGAGLNVPEAIEVRENVLVMQFMGEEDWEASPRLKDAELPSDPEFLRNLYLELLLILRTIFHRCRLVHADLSEYNILYHQSHLWVIDVSQSVEHDHPAAFDFLRSDIGNMDAFFERKGVRTLGLRRTFDYVTKRGPNETDEEMSAEALRLVDLVESGELTTTDGLDETEREVDARNAQKESDDAVFAKSYIPRALDDVYDPERDVARVLRGEGDALIYADITGVAVIREREAKQEGVRFAPGVKEGDASDAEDDEESAQSGSEGSESGSDNEDEEGKERRPRGKKFEDKDEKKKRRAETKEKARDKRKDKMSKSDKARKVRKTSGKR